VADLRLRRAVDPRGSVRRHDDDDRDDPHDGSAAMRRRRIIALVAVPLAVMSALAALAPLARGKTVIRIDKVTRTADAHFVNRPGQPVFILVIGNDGRPGIDGARGDALHVIGVNPAAGKATILDIPRDTYVAIPGHGHDKINSAYAYGGPLLEAQAVSDLTGVPIGWVVSTNFDGFIGMVDELGGVDVNVPYPMHDSFSGADFQPGVQHMDGHAALAFSRDRHLGDGDITRSYDQGLLVLAALGKLRADRGSPTAVVRDIAVLARHAELHGVGLRDLYRLGRLGLSIDPGNVRNVVMPWRLGSVGAASVVFVGPGADGLFADFRDDALLESH
jgi:LCP family protein required for cell wall assembly